MTVKSQNIKNSQWKAYIPELTDTAYITILNDTLRLGIGKQEIMKSVVSFVKDTLSVVDVGTTPCGNGIGRYLYFMKNNELLLKIISEPCTERSDIGATVFTYVSVAPRTTR